MILEVKNVTFYYHRRRKRPILDQVSLTIHPGERVGLTAPSGRGKTTLCRLMAGYEYPRRGEVLLDGRPVAGYQGVCPVQMLWQHPEMAVDPLLRLGVTLKESGMDGSEQKERMEQLGIHQEWLRRFPSELSGGELQRFCLVRALRPGVQFLLCDEISAMLDLATQARIWNVLLEEAERRGLGLLIVSHDEALLERVCTRQASLSELQSGILCD